MTGCAASARAGIDNRSASGPDQRRPTRLTGPPRFIGRPAPPTPGVTTARRAPGRGRSPPPGLAMQPAGYSTYWQYTTALALSVLAATRPATRPIVSSVDSTIDGFIPASSIIQKVWRDRTIWSLTQIKLSPVRKQTVSSAICGQPRPCIFEGNLPAPVGMSQTCQTRKCGQTDRSVS